MSMSDPIADLLTRIRNANQARHAQVDIPASRLKQGICEVLAREGFIRECERLDEGPQGTLRVTMKYTAQNQPVISGLLRVSKPSLRVYKRAKEIRPVRSGLGIAIMSTSQGVMTSKAARNAQVGGEVLCEVW